MSERRLFKFIDRSLIVAVALQLFWFAGVIGPRWATPAVIGLAWLFIVSMAGQQLDRMGYFQKDLP